MGTSEYKKTDGLLPEDKAPTDLQECEEALDIDPDNPSVWLNKGNVLFKLE